MRTNKQALESTLSITSVAKITAEILCTLIKSKPLSKASFCLLQKLKRASLSLESSLYQAKKINKKIKLKSYD